MQPRNVGSSNCSTSSPILALPAAPPRRKPRQPVAPPAAPPRHQPAPHTHTRSVSPDMEGGPPPPQTVNNMHCSVGPSVSADVSASILGVAGRLLLEGLKKLDDDPASALVALKQCFALEVRFGEEAETLCKACVSLCRGLSRAAAPLPPSEAVAVLVQALDTIEARAKRRAGGARGGQGSAAAAELREGEEEARSFLARELLGLARRLAGVSTDQSTYAKEVRASPAPPPRLDDLRSADRAYERLVLMAEALGPLRLGGASHNLVVTQEELLFQQSQQARAIGVHLARENTPRAIDAALFYYQRAMRKLRVAGVNERTEHVEALRRLISSADVQADNLKAASRASGGGGERRRAQDGGDAAARSTGKAGGGHDEGDNGSCLVS